MHKFNSNNGFDRDFNTKFNNMRKWIIRAIVAGFIIIIIGANVLTGWWVVNTVNEEGGVQATLTKLLKIAKQIDKDSDK